MSRVVILAFSLGIAAGLVLAFDVQGLDVVPYYMGDDRAALQKLVEALDRY